MELGVRPHMHKIIGGNMLVGLGLILVVIGIINFTAFFIGIGFISIFLGSLFMLSVPRLY